MKSSNISKHQYLILFSRTIYKMVTFNLLVEVKSVTTFFTPVSSLIFMPMHVTSKVTWIFTFIITVCNLTLPGLSRVYIHMLGKLTSIFVALFTKEAVMFKEVINALYGDF